jgi:hypothetical protein
MDYKDLLKNKKMLLLTFITFFFLLSYYLDNWEKIEIKTPGEGKNIIGLNNITTYDPKDECSILKTCYKNFDTDNSDINKGFNTASSLMKIYLLLLIIGLVLYYKDQNEYKIYIEGIFAFLGVLGIIIYSLFIKPNTNKIIDIFNKKDSVSSKSIGISSILLILTSLGCLAFAGLSYTKNI